MIRSLITGLAGAAALTLAHELIHKRMPQAPRMDFFGLGGVDQILSKLGFDTRSANGGPAKTAIIADLISNTIYFSGVGATRGASAWLRGLILGLSAGMGIIGLSPKGTLDKPEVCRDPKICATTVGLYVLGGLASALTANIIGRRK